MQPQLNGVLSVLLCIVLFGCSQSNESTNKEAEIIEPRSRGEINEPASETHSAYKRAKYDELKALVRTHQFDDAMALCDQLLDEYGYNAFVIAHKSIAYSGMVNKIEDDEMIESYLKQAFNYANEAMVLDSSIKWSNVAMALAYAKQASVSGFTDKASYSKLANKYSRKVLGIDPYDPVSNFILGRFYLEVADLSGPASFIARPILGKEEIDKASFDLALSHLKKSSGKQPDRFIYVFYTGVALSKADKDQEALRYFQKAKALTPQSAEEYDLYQGLDKLIKKAS